MKKLFFLFCLIFIQFAHAQFSIEKFPNEAQNFLGQEYDKKEAKKFIEDFIPVWISINSSHKEQIVTFANAMAAKSVKAYPAFLNYLESVKGFAQNNHNDESFRGWMSILDKLINAREKKQLPDFLAFSSGLFQHGTIYKSSSVEWRVKEKNFSFEFENNIPKVNFNNVTLGCYMKFDSSLIYKTNGVLYPLKDSWEGKQGIITWERAELKKEETFGELKRYNINLKSTGFTSDSVIFHTPYFKQPLLGRVIEKVVKNSERAKAVFPEFQSYSKRLFIKNIFPNIDYDGGFAMQGASLFGSGTAEQLAQLIFYNKDKKFIVIKSTAFIIKPDAIDSEKAEANVYIDKDSITQPNLRLKYTQKDNRVILSRGKDGLSQAPFNNSYHKLDMFFEALYWKVGDPLIEFGPIFGSTDYTARFESVNFYSSSVYRQMQQMDEQHPMVPIEHYSIRLDTTVLKISDLASYMGRTTEMIIPTIGELTRGGFITYDPDRQLVFVKQKLFDYLKANAKKIDYDCIELYSDLTPPQDEKKRPENKKNQDVEKNAILNLQTYDLIIKGVKPFNLSDSQFVKVFPKNQEIIVRKNRDMKFAGAIRAGQTEFFGSEFYFNYNDFKIDLIACDSMRLRVKPWPKDIRKDMDLRQQAIRVTSKIIGVKGNVVLDGKDNKSGIKRGYEKYPILNSTKETYVFYNDKSIHRGVYDSSIFYFKIDPFVMDSLDNYTTQAVEFKGELTSAGILPKLKETLKVQKDYSLGFIRKIPEPGITLYGDKAVLKNEVRLSNKGLQAEGKVTFLTSVADSKEFTLFPDSLAGVAQSFINTESKTPVEVPQVRGVNVYVRYVPKQKVIYAQSQDSLIDFMGNQSKLRGQLALRPGGMTGRGKMFFGKGELSAKEFKYKTKIIDSDTAAFRLKDYDLNVHALKTENVNAHVDFTQRVGEFKSNDKNTFIEFPQNQYICFMDRFKWYMDKEDIEMVKDRKGGNVDIESDIDMTMPNFFSVHPEQDSLRFLAPKARYDMRKHVITCNGVEFMPVADARIYPDSQRVIIRKQAKMDELNNAKIVANSITKYHNLYNAKVTVLAKRKYTAAADYSYRDENNMEQKIRFDNIYVDSTFQTYAKGKIEDNENFMLSPHFQYKGGVELKAADVGLNFNGGVRLLHNCSFIDKNWLKFKAVVDPKDIKIPVGELDDYDGGKLGTGITIISDSSGGFYPTFLSKKIKSFHPDMTQAKGVLIFDKKTQQYQIATSDKLNDRTLPGTFVALAKEKCEIEGDGKINFGNNSGQLKITTVGNVKYDTKTKNFHVNASMLIDFPFSENALEKMAESINNAPDLMPFDFDKSNFEKALREILPDAKDADKIMSDLRLKGEHKRWYEAAKSIFIGDINMYWDEELQLFYSKGKIGISNILNKQVMKYVDGAVVIEKRQNVKDPGSEDVIHIVLLVETKYYYFRYRREVMDCGASGDEKFNSVISELKEDKRTFKAEKGEKKEFIYQLNTSIKGAERGMVRE